MSNDKLEQAVRDCCDAHEAYSQALQSVGQVTNERVHALMEAVIAAEAGLRAALADAGAKVEPVADSPASAADGVAAMVARLKQSHCDDGDPDVADEAASLIERLAADLAAMTAKRDEELAVCDQAVGRLDDVRAALAAMTASLDDVRAVVNEQADDPALWLIQPTITEEYLQRALRRLHAVIDAAIAKGAA